MKAISSLQRAIRLNLTAPMSNWQDKEFEEALDALENSLLLHNTFVTYASTAGSTEVDSLRTSLKYMFSQVLSRVDIFIRDTMRPADESGSKYDLILEKNNILKEASKSYGLV